MSILAEAWGTEVMEGVDGGPHPFLLQDFLLFVLCLKAHHVSLSQEVGLVRLLPLTQQQVSLDNGRQEGERCEKRTKRLRGGREEGERTVGGGIGKREPCGRFPYDTLSQVE
jgi:hypothetical protein